MSSIRDALAAPESDLNTAIGEFIRAAPEFEGERELVRNVARQMGDPMAVLDHAGTCYRIQPGSRLRVLHALVDDVFTQLGGLDNVRTKILNELLVAEVNVRRRS